MQTQIDEMMQRGFTRPEALRCIAAKVASVVSGATFTSQIPSLQSICSTVSIPEGWSHIPPFLDEVILGELDVDLDVYARALHLLTQYAISGIEGHCAGTTVALGIACELIDSGYVERSNPFRGEDHDVSLCVNADPLVRRLNDDGMIVAEGRNPGRAAAAGFKASGVDASSKSSGGGMRSKSCAYLSARFPKSLLLKVSQDSIGQVDVYRAGTSSTYFGALAVLRKSSDQTDAALSDTINSYAFRQESSTTLSRPETRECATMTEIGTFDCNFACKAAVCATLAVGVLQCARTWFPNQTA